MIDRKDIENVRNIMKKAKDLTTEKIDKEKLDTLIRGFDDAANRYLQEVHTNVTIQ